MSTSRKSDDHDLHCFLISIFTEGLHLDGALRRVDDVLGISRCDWWAVGQVRFGDRVRPS